MLSVEGKQPSAKQFQVGSRSSTPGDESAGSPAGRDSPAKNDLIGILRQTRGNLSHLRLAEHPLRKIEDTLDPRLLRPGPNDLRSRLTAHQQIKRMRQHRLPRAGLA